MERNFYIELAVYVQSFTRFLLGLVKDFGLVDKIDMSHSGLTQLIISNPRNII